jgi:predicted MFS family arabinose efflux permease
MPAAGNAAPDRARRPRRSRRPGGLLWQRNFLLLWTGETVSQTGNAMAVVGVPLLAVEVLHASTFAVSALTAAAYLPWLVMGLPAGAWVDRLPPRPLMVTCDIVSALLFASLPAAAWLDVLTTGQVLAVALLAGAANVFFGTAYQVYLPALVAADELMEANAKLQGSMSVALLGGRSLAGLAAQALGDATALLCNAASFLVSAGCLLSIRGVAPKASQRLRDTTIRAEIQAGARFIARDALLRALTGYVAAANLTFSGGSALFVVFLVRVAGLEAAGVGLLMAATGVGGIAGALTARRVTARLGTARTLILSTAGTSPFALLMPLAGPGPRLACYVIGSFVVGVGITPCNIILTSFRQSYVPAAMLGRITASQRFLLFGTIPVGALLAGTLGTALGVRDALWIMLAGYVLSPALLLGRAIRGRRDLPTTATILPGEA